MNMTQDHLRIGRNLASDHQFAAAICEFSLAIQQFPSQAEAYFQRGLAYAIIGDEKKAMSDFDMAIDIDRRRPGVWNARALAFFRIGDFDAAVDDVNEAIRLDKSDSRFVANRGRFEFHRRNYSEAMKDLSSANLPDRTAYLLGMIYYMQGDYHESVAQFDAARVDRGVTSWRLIWSYCARQFIGNKEVVAKELETYFRTVSRDGAIWPIPLVGYFAGAITGDDLFKSLDSDKRREASFFLAQNLLASGECSHAHTYLRRMKPTDGICYDTAVRQLKEHTRD